MGVYVIGSSESGPVKVGKARRAEERRRTLQTSHHEKLRIFHYAECHSDAKVEKLCHNRLVRYRLAGEWFNVSADEAWEIVQGAALEIDHCEQGDRPTSESNFAWRDLSLADDYCDLHYAVDYAVSCLLNALIQRTDLRKEEIDAANSAREYMTELLARTEYRTTAYRAPPKHARIYEKKETPSEPAGISNERDVI